ncbi:MAG TPA: hypothetical protein VIM64_17645 [Puia sp.]
MKKIKLRQLDLTPLTHRELSKVLGGYTASTTGITSQSSGPSASTSITNGVDYDTSTGDSDPENDTSMILDPKKEKLFMV